TAYIIDIEMFRRPGKAEAATRQTCEHYNEDRFVITRKPSVQRAFFMFVRLQLVTILNNYIDNSNHYLYHFRPLRM
ncbi:hypothetical protein, partial [Klebsiella pneumoniae]|uniref:hypothetical protein n=1 Tax=Klebsiella pneumoniae TaxID=573 RepID=UPI00272F528C